MVIDLDGLVPDNPSHLLAWLPTNVKRAFYLGSPHSPSLPGQLWICDEKTNHGPDENTLKTNGPFVVYSDPVDAELNPVPPMCREETAPITFGYLGNPLKLNQATISMYANIMKETKKKTGKEVKLYFRYASYDGPFKDTLERMLEIAGIDIEDVIIEGGRVSAKEHAECYHKVDIALDSYPYTGTTTYCEAMLQGVPVVGLKGGQEAPHVTNVTASLQPEGLDLLGTTEEKVISKAVELASNPELLKQYRTRLPTLLQEHLGTAERLASELKQLIRLVC